MTAIAPAASALAANALVARKNDFVLSGPVGSFDAYMDKVSRIPVLSREDEADLAKRFRNDGDLEAAIVKLQIAPLVVGRRLRLSIAARLSSGNCVVVGC